MFQYLLMVFFAIAGVSLSNSVKIIRQGDEALVEMFGRYDGRKLQPGISFLTPFVEQVAYKQTMREQTLKLPTETCTTYDRFSVSVDFIVYWRVIDLEKAFYKVENLKEAMMNLLLISIRTEIAKLDAEELYTARSEINNALVEELDNMTESWGIKFTRVELRNFSIDGRVNTMTNNSNSQNKHTVKSSVMV